MATVSAPTDTELVGLQQALRDAATDPRYSAELSRLKSLPGAQQVVCEIAASPLGAQNLLNAVYEYRVAAFVGGVIARRATTTTANTATTPPPLYDAPNPGSRADAVLGKHARGWLQSS